MSLEETMRFNPATRFERLRDEAIPAFCEWCTAGFRHERHGVSANSETFRTHQLSIIKKLYEANIGEYDLQDLFDACCEVYRYSVNSAGYQSAAADAVGRIVGRMIYGSNDIYNALRRRSPPDCRAGLSTNEVCREAGLAFEGWSKKFYLLRDVARVTRRVPRVKCSTCGKCYDGWREPNSPDWRNKWRDYLIPSQSTRNTLVREQWSCSWACFLKAQKQLDKEIKWLKIANQRIKQARTQIRRAAQNPVARQSLDART